MIYIGTKTAKCNNCDTTDTKIDIGSALGHKYGNYIIVDEKYHQHICINDSSHIEIENHNFENNICIDCGYSLQIYLVTFNMNSHGNQVSNQMIKTGNKVCKPITPTAKGYIFDGWHSDADCFTEFDFNTAITQDTVIYAKWTERNNINKIFLISGLFTAGGGIVAGIIL